MSSIYIWSNYLLYTDSLHHNGVDLRFQIYMELTGGFCCSLVLFHRKLCANINFASGTNCNTYVGFRKTIVRTNQPHIDVISLFTSKRPMVVRTIILGETSISVFKIYPWEAVCLRENSSNLTKLENSKNG